MAMVASAALIIAEAQSIPYIWASILPPCERFTDVERSRISGHLTVAVHRAVLEYYVRREYTADVYRELDEHDWPSEYWERKCEIENDYY